MATNVDKVKEKTKVLFAKKQLAESGGQRVIYRNEIVSLNMPLVTTVLRKYIPYTEDQFQIGCLGLIKAADTYEMAKEVPFHNYACFVIERELHMDYNRRMDSIEEKMKDRITSLDYTVKSDNGDNIDISSLVEDPKATEEIRDLIEHYQVQHLCDEIIRPSIQELADKGRESTSKMNFSAWEQLEFRYIMSIVFGDVQQNKFTMAQMAKACDISVPNVRNRHLKVMDLIFQRMWHHMIIPYNELLNRIRGNYTIPERLLCLDPGKTTGWCLFTNGKLTSWGQVDDCYDDNNINIQGLMDLFQATQPTFICYEDYRVYSHKLSRHTYSPVMTVRLLGTIETYCQMNNIATHKQMASTAKTFCTDEKMKAWGFWQEGMRHARDAIRHGCYFLLFYKKGQNIV